MTSEQHIELWNEHKDKAMKALKDFLKPEFLGRVDDIIAFAPFLINLFIKSIIVPSVPISFHVFTCFVGPHVININIRTIKAKILFIVFFINSNKKQDTY